MVALEVDSFLLSAAAQHHERHYGKRHSRPLPCIESLTEHQHRSHKSHHGTRGIDRTDYRQGQMLDTEISQYPTAQYDKTLQHYELMHIPSAAAHVEYCSVESVGRVTDGDKRNEYRR